MFSSLDSLWQWITENASTFSAITSVGMLIIWATYLQLLLHNFRMQRRSQIIINRGKGRDINSICLFSNMSRQSVFIDLVMARVTTSNAQWVCNITDVVDDTGKPLAIVRQEEGVDASLNEFTRQGPMVSGGYSEVGTFANMIHQAGMTQGIEFDEHFDIAGDGALVSIEIRLIAIFGSETHQVGASRTFYVEKSDEDGRLLLIPENTRTQQLRKRKQRHILQHWRHELQAVPDE
ncbi:hypothetical protein SAMN05421848_2426 [Kushneria avicenniae]|uniref:Uncharacterized protein n=1 Tax=Kushneria avicenniae TaxID=402385 RepID=A0A1I1LF82_9GAMM|nr:hypothetical protein [Kushneria avicenniae]SFC71827.1 hypothetical protein SAMN05421848_2426 [Kushneria avicenniae]